MESQGWRNTLKMSPLKVRHLKQEWPGHLNLSLYLLGDCAGKWTALRLWVCFLDRGEHRVKVFHILLAKSRGLYVTQICPISLVITEKGKKTTIHVKNLILIMQWIYPGDTLLTFFCNAAVWGFGFKADYINGYFPASTTRFWTCPMASAEPACQCHLCNTAWPYWVSSLGSTMIFVSPRPNGTLPGSVEIQNNTIYFKGPVSYSVAGTYICEASNAIGTRSGLVEVNVTGRKTLGVLWKTEEEEEVGRGQCERLTNTSHLSESPVSPRGGEFHDAKGAVKFLGLHQFCTGLPWIFFSFPLVVFSFLTPRYVPFVSPLSSALDSERSLDMLKVKTCQGDIC